MVIKASELKGKKLALVFSGGGARGAYQIGVWKALKDMDLEVDIVTGISVGALNGAFVAQDDLDQAIQMWQHVSTSDILDYQENDLSTLGGYSKNLTTLFYQAIKEGGISTEPLVELVETYLDDDQAMTNFSADFGVVVTNTETRKPESYYLNHLKREDVKDLLIASASLYPIMEKRYINEEAYADGGYRNHIPLDLALEHDPEFVIIVDLQPEQKVQLPLNNDHIQVVQPRLYLGDMMTFDINRNRINLKLGYNDMMKSLGEYGGRIYSFTDCGHDYQTDLHQALEGILKGQIYPGIGSFINKRKDFLIEKIGREWGYKVTKDNFHIAILEVAARLFYYPAEEAVSTDDFISNLLDRVNQLYHMDKSDALDEVLPDFFLGYSEWYEYYSRKFSILPEQERIFRFLDMFKDPDRNLSEWTLHILFRIDPVPFSVALFLNYLNKNEKKLSYP